MVTRSAVGADAALIDALPNLEIISIFGVGADKVDLAAAKNRGIHVTTPPGVQTEDTADYRFGLLLALARKIVIGDRYIRKGHWKNGFLPSSTRVYSKKLGIVGLGRIGEAVARRAAALRWMSLTPARAPSLTCLTAMSTTRKRWRHSPTLSF